MDVWWFCKYESMRRMRMEGQWMYGGMRVCGNGWMMADRWMAERWMEDDGWMND